MYIITCIYVYCVYYILHVLYIYIYLFVYYILFILFIYIIRICFVDTYTSTCGWGPFYLNHGGSPLTTSSNLVVGLIGI